jgi:hypothetical protein
VNHYHIRWTRWSESKLDWEVFNTRNEAEVAAKEMVMADETYAVEQFDGDCLCCNEARKAVARHASNTLAE